MPHRDFRFDRPGSRSLNGLGIKGSNDPRRGSGAIRGRGSEPQKDSCGPIRCAANVRMLGAWFPQRWLTILCRIGDIGTYSGIEVTGSRCVSDATTTRLHAESE